jgi:hypothetical protein
MNQLDPLELVDALESSGVPVVIIGGHAVNFHGFLRATEDIDLVFRRDEPTEEKLLQVLQDWRAYWISDEIDPNTGLEITVPVAEDYIRRQHLMMLGTHAGYVDLFDFVPGYPQVPVDDLFATAVVCGRRRFVSLEWLKKMKLAASRPQDCIDLENLP